MHTAVITGGTGGMGLATARLLGETHRVVIADLSRVRLDAATAELTSAGIDAMGVVCDITDRASVTALFESAAAGGHHVRAVVHAAGVSPQMGDAEFIARVNALGTVNVTEAYLTRAAAGDALVNVASYAGHALPGFLVPTRAFPRATTDPEAFLRAVVRRSRIARARQSGLSYALSKAFVIWYSQRVAAAFGAVGARVISVSPGSFDTPMGQLEADHGASDLLTDSALKRFGRPDEIAAVLAFAASEAPGYLTGTDVLVDGGTLAGSRSAKRR